MTPSGHDPRSDSDGYRSSSSSDEDAVDGPATATTATHEGWKMWQRVIDATTGGVSGVASAVKNRMNAEEGLCESDEEDYAGVETHLTRVMKEYYISQSSSPADLPQWLFPDRPAHHTRAWASAAEPRSSGPAARSPAVVRESLDHSRAFPARAVKPSLIQAPRYPSGEGSPSAVSNREEGISGRRNFTEQSAHQMHGNRTAQKLRQMKTQRNVSNPVS